MSLTTLGWDTATAALEGFGGDEVTLRVLKTGMPFFDALRLYGAIDLYVGVREDVNIKDGGDAWTVIARSRVDHVSHKEEAAFHAVYKNQKPIASEYCREMKEEIVAGKQLTRRYTVPVQSGWDAALQTGIRGVSAYEYETLQSGQTSRKESKAFVALSDAILAYAGRRRVESLGDILFIPIFEGPIDLSKVVSPLRARIGLPNVLCAQALALLMLKTSLFIEGYQERLSAVAFNTNLSGNRSDNYSGTVAVRSTVIGRVQYEPLLERLYRTLRELVRRGWRRHGQSFQTTDFTQHALAMAYWLIQPTAQHLTAMIGSQERLRARGAMHFLTRSEYVREVFKMTFGPWTGDHEAVRQFARSVASAIYYARMAKEKVSEDRNKAWYDEVTMLRSAPSPKAFRERALILIEQGHRENPFVGTSRRGEAFEPAALLTSIGDDRAAFETFRDLFRMYLIQESTPWDGSAVAGHESIAEAEGTHEEEETE